MTQVPPPPGGGQPQSHLQPHRGVLILVFGILGLLICFIFGIVAWVMGNNDLRAMDAGTMDPEGRGLTQAGRIIGMIATILALVVVVFWIVVVVVGVGAAALGG